MQIKIFKLSGELFSALNNSGFIEDYNIHTLHEYSLYDVVLKDTVILKAGVNIVLDKGGHYITLYSADFERIELV